MDYLNGKIQVKHFINGQWCRDDESTTMPIYNPSTGDIIGDVPCATDDEVKKALVAAKNAFKEWRQVAVGTRAKYLFALRNQMESNLEELAQIIARDQAKNIADARGEVGRVIQIVENACGLPNMLIGESFEISPEMRGQVHRKPLGVIAALSPFNFPALVFGWFIPYAIGCGNTVVYKANEQSPLFMQRMMEIFSEIGLPDGVINLVNGDAAVGERLICAEDVKGVCFVGSTAVGRKIAQTAAQHGKRSQVLAGAKNSLLVLADCDREGFLAQLKNSAFGAAGQRCMAGSNVLIEAGCYDEMVERIVDMAKAVPVGDARDENAYMGPVISAKSVERIRRCVDEAVKEGAELILDGREPNFEGDLAGGFFVKPTILTGVTPEMTIIDEEIFGPVLSLIKVDDFETGLNLMNQSRYGNGGSLFTQNGYYAEQFLNRIDVGMAGINVGVPASMPYLPFGGTKDSLLGSGLKAQGHDGIEFFTKRNVATIQFFKR